MSTAMPASASIEADALKLAMRRRVEASGTSFYFAMRLLPEARRDAMFAIYAFCREVDDIADEGGTRAAKREGLARWRKEIDLLYAGQPQHEIARALVEPVQNYQLRQEDFIALIDGMAMDAEGPICAPNFQTLDLYCDRVASAVGRLSVRAFGCATPDADLVAYHLGRALQLTNILRDVAEDAELGRLYLPAELLIKHGISSHDPLTVAQTPNTSLVCRDLAKTAQEHFIAAEAALKRCPSAPMRPARMMAAVYRAILDKLVADQFRDLTNPTSLSQFTKIWIALRHGFF